MAAGSARQHQPPLPLWPDEQLLLSSWAVALLGWPWAPSAFPALCSCLPGASEPQQGARRGQGWLGSGGRGEKGAEPPRTSPAPVGMVEGTRLHCGNRLWIVPVCPGCLNVNQFNWVLIKAVVNQLKSLLLQFSREILTAEVGCYLMEAGGFELVTCKRHVKN